MKSGVAPADTALTWTSPAGNGAEEHLNAVAAKTDIPAPASKRASAGIGEPRCTIGAGAGGCSDPGLVADPRRLLFLQAYAACGPDGSDEGVP